MSTKTMGKKINCSKINLNIKNINIIYLRKTNRLLMENPSTRKPGKKTRTQPGIYC